MTESIASIFQSGLERYSAGESTETLLPVFQDICDRLPKNASALSCLAWLYLLEEQPKLALKAARKSVKLDPRAPQARINLVLAMLDCGEKGVRNHIEIVQQIMAIDKQVRDDIAENIRDGLSRKSDWKSLERVKGWLMS